MSRDNINTTTSFLSTFGIRLAVNSLAHPFEYAKVLIQIGHEPLPTFPTRTLFGKPAQGLPNVFTYVNYIKNIDGYSGCYRGFTPKLTAQLISLCVSKNVATKFPEDKFDRETILTDEEQRTQFINNLTKNIACRTASIVVSHPFHVISLRMMAEFVGGEQKYTGIVASIIEIYREQGILGYFSGLLPRWLGEMISLVLASTVTFALSCYLIQDKEIQSFAEPTIQYITSTLTYPFTVVSSCMAVNNCGLIAGLPPNMPIYKKWTECWAHLSANNQLNRGSSLLWRYYFKPTATITSGGAIVRS